MIYSALAFFLILALSCVSASPLSAVPNYSSYTFERFEAEYGKAYGSATARNHARAVFQSNLAKIAAHNAREDKTYFMAINRWADLTAEEVTAKYTGYNKAMGGSKAKRFGAVTPATANFGDVPLPSELDWRSSGAVTAVKDQGSCGSCWAFSATESIESALYLSTGQHLLLSPQDVVQCTPNPQHCGGTGGCAGATPELAFEWAANGIATEDVVPYKAQDATCKNVTRAAKVGGYVKIEENNATALLQAVAAVGPISVSVDASAWGLYGGGIFNGCNAANPDINHAVQLVGFGEENGTGYWLVRNSWGTSWGEQGYIRLYRGEKETCGTDTRPQDGSGCDGGPATVKVCGTCGIWYDNSYPTNVGLF